MSLNFNYIDEDELLESLSNEHTDISELDFGLVSFEGDSLLESIDQASKDLTLITEVKDSIYINRGVCQADVESLESLRGRYVELDNFLSNNDKALFTKEPSLVLYESSNENFIKNAAVALWNLLVRVGKWIWEQLVKIYEWVKNIFVNNKKVSIKLQSYPALSKYLTQIRSELENILAGPAILKSSRNKGLMNMDRGDSRAYTYILHVNDFDDLVKVMTETVEVGLSGAVDYTTELVREIQTVFKVGDMGGKYDYTELANRFKAKIHNLPKASLLDQKLDGLMSSFGIRTNVKRSVIDPLLLDSALTKINTLPVVSKDGVKVQPNHYDRLTKYQDEQMGTITDDWFMDHQRSIPDLIKKSSHLKGDLEKLDRDIKASRSLGTVVGEQLMIEVVILLQTTITKLTAIHKQSLLMLEQRINGYDTLVISMLNEVNELAAWIESNKQSLTVGIQASHNRLWGNVKTAVKSGRYR